jgi:hypothetical protein
MTTPLSQRWAEQFGLAHVPLFGEEIPDNRDHAVLLDGGAGSFVLSETDEELWRERTAANWAWSSDMPHHVTVTEKVVAITRWDKPLPDILTRKSVEAKLESFYEYLTADRVRSNQGVIQHALTMFRRARSLAADARLPDEQSIDIFLALLARAIEQEVQSGGIAAPPHSQELEDSLAGLSRPGMTSWLQDVFAAPDEFRLHPAMAVRHAGASIFQEAHFALLRSPQVDMFGYAGPSVSQPITRGGAHFTPAPLARAVTEQTLAQIAGLTQRQDVVVADPACGSGAFLHEAMRTLRRLGFQGRLQLIGRDLSPAAIRMAEFVVRHAQSEWEPAGGIRIDLRVEDSLANVLPPCDAILMNPPFVSWSALSLEQRDRMKDILSHKLKGRGDLSMAFIWRAAEALRPGGALGVLFPTSLLTLQAAEAWRSELLKQTDMRLIASLGDYGLFVHAMVQVAAAVFAKPIEPQQRQASTLALVTSNSTEATGKALRTLRKHSSGASAGAGDHASWRLFEVPAERFAKAPTWRIVSPRIEQALSRLIDAGMGNVKDVFEVKQGIRSGNNHVFLLKNERYRALPARERQWFRPALMSDSIQDGRIVSSYWLFYPHQEAGSAFESEEAMVRAVPTYAAEVLMPHKDALSRRGGVVGGRRSDWWGLVWPRSTWALDRKPQLVSKYFGGQGGFGVDLESKYLVVQGYAWRPKDTAPELSQRPDALSVADFLHAYAALMNSMPFGKLLALFSPHVSGGQFDLSPRYTNAVPLPNLRDLAREERAGRLVLELARLGRELRVIDADWNVQVSRVVSELYGTRFFDDL